MILEAIERIRQMEQCFDMLQDVENTNPKAFLEDASVKEEMQILLQYYEGGQWLRDYELDEAGLLPHNLKRGVLSEDAVYNFLTRIENFVHKENGA